MKVGFMGAGNMAAAMARGWAGAESRPEEQLFFDLDGHRAAAIAAEVGGRTASSPAELREEAEVVVLAVKPNALDAAAEDLERRAPALISLLAATPVERVAAAFPDVPVLRVMPNQPVEVRRGVLCYAEPHRMHADVAARLLDLLRPLGALVPVDERAFDAAMAVMSCSPAYVAVFAHALIEAAEQEGLDPALATTLVAGAIEGTAAMLRERHPQHIRAAVAPPGGATEAGLEALERAGFSEAVTAAVVASLERFR